MSFVGYLSLLMTFHIHSWGEFDKEAHPSWIRPGWQHWVVSQIYMENHENYQIASMYTIYIFLACIHLIIIVCTLVYSWFQSKTYCLYHTYKVLIMLSTPLQPFIWFKLKSYVPSWMFTWNETYKSHRTCFGLLRHTRADSRAQAVH